MNHVISGRPMAARLKMQKGGSGWSRLFAALYAAVGS